MHRKEDRRILPVAKISENFTDRLSATPYTRSLQNFSCTQYRQEITSG
jgi:hypothetical protein